jgi:Glycerophosphoryl diester phosphodiesterase family
MNLNFRSIRSVAPAIVVLAGVALSKAADEKKPEAAVVPLTHAHAHNDYEHTRPLFEALENGFCSVEADVFLVNGKLLVGHTLSSLRPERTLESLYLDPLRERAKANGGKIYPGGPTIFLLVDVKSKGKETCAAVLKVLDGYEDLVSVTRDGKFEPRAVTVVVSGNCDRETITAPAVRRAGIDGRPSDLDSDAAVDLIPWISDSWRPRFHWKGEGPIPDEERARLRDFTAKAHRHGRLVRFWATPENADLWKELRTDGVDLLNTDKLAELRGFLLKEGQEQEKR